ncbi:hypothetical protein F4818DRAFT_443048 [Hypoxylon cercidicola]|nr:hypothetical protein F4818DRAFT_443048 [Hypoxylon cercidicola]
MSTTDPYLSEDFQLKRQRLNYTTTSVDRRVCGTPLPPPISELSDPPELSDSDDTPAALISEERGESESWETSTIVVDTQQFWPLPDEFGKLRTQIAFGTVDPQGFNRPDNDNCTVRDVCSTEWLENTLELSKTQLQTQSPILYDFLSIILTNQRPDRGGGLGDSFKARSFLIAALLLNAFSPKTSTFLPIMIGIYLHNSGVPRRVIETLAVFGSNLKRVTHDPSAVFVYDNFNFIDRVRDLALGRKDVMQNLTNCLVVASPDKLAAELDALASKHTGIPLPKLGPRPYTYDQLPPDPNYVDNLSPELETGRDGTVHLQVLLGRLRRGEHVEV